MKKYIIVLVLCLLLGFLFGRAAYAQENYFTPQQTMKALQESKESKEKEVNDTEVHDEYRWWEDTTVNDTEVREEREKNTSQDEISYYYEQYTYKDYEDCEDNAIFSTKYAIHLQNVKYADIEFTLTYEQPIVFYASALVTVPSIEKFVTSMSNNIIVVCATITYCRSMGYEDEIIQSLGYLLNFLHDQYTRIRDFALKCLDSYKENNFTSCIKYILAIENIYWELYIQMGTLGNPNSDDIKQVSFTYTPSDEDSDVESGETEQAEELEENAWWR